MLTAPVTAQDLRFDPVAHTSYTALGQEVPHVTKILQAVGVSTDFEGLTAMSPFIAGRILARRELGTLVHAATHAYDENLPATGVQHDPEVEAFVLAWADFRQRSGLVPVTRETRLFHPVYWYAGAMDGIFLDPSERRILVDLKIGDPDAAACHFQTAAYEAAWTHAHPDQPIDERWAVQLCPYLAVPFRVTNYSRRPDARLDFRKFQAFVTTYHEQAARRRRIA